MYHYDNRSELYRLHPQQQVSLEKHQRMIHNTLEWQRLSKLAGEEQKPVVIMRLKLALVTVFNLLIGR